MRLNPYSNTVYYPILRKVVFGIRIEQSSEGFHSVAEDGNAANYSVYFAESSHASAVSNS